MPPRTHLVADIGGTWARVFLARGGVLQEGVRLRVAAYASAEAALKGAIRLLAPGKLSSAVLAVAGPIDGNEVTLTNLGWRTNAAKLSKAVGATVTVTNDAVAHAWGVAHAKPHDLHRWAGRKKRFVPEATFGVIVPGTGLGECVMIWAGDQFVAAPTEAGHANASAESKMARRVLSDLGAPTVEDVLSASGLATIAQVVANTKRTPEDLTQGSDPVATNVIRLYSEFLAVEARQLALRGLCLGGIVFAGNLINVLRERVDPEQFSAVFVGNGPHAKELARIPLILASDAALSLRGCIALLARS